MSSDLGSQHLPMQSKQATPMGPMSNSLGSQQISVLNKRVAQMTPCTLSSPSLQQMSNPNKRMTQMVSLPKNLGSQQSSLLGKRMTHVEPMQTNLAPQQSSASNKRNAQMGPSPKGQTESYELVRAKLRESLADSLGIVSKQQTKSVGNDSQDKAANTLRPGNGDSQLSDMTTISTEDSSCHIPEKSSKDSDSAQKVTFVQSPFQEVLANDMRGDSIEKLKSDGHEFQYNYVLQQFDEDVAFSNNFFVKDELLQGNGLCWASDLEVQVVQPVETHSAKRSKLVHEETVGYKKSPQDVATRIEAELFKFFGGVNKNYKLKGRSLLFNLKDPSNPELKERVLSGEIPPERLCAMTAEELASKELSQWRIAKAEEFALMVVLPDSSGDVRRLVKKTHKGEFQVEFDQDDGASVEVAMEASSLPQFQPKIDEKEAGGVSKPIQTITSEGGIHEKVNSEDQKLQTSLTTLPDDGTDLMQSLIVDDELKDVDFLPPIVSLDEFMESLDSEPPFENLAVDSGKTMVEADEKDNPDNGSRLESSDLVDASPDKPEKAEVTYTSDCNPKSKIEGEPETSTIVSTPKRESKANNNLRESVIPSIVVAPEQDHVWEGLLKLNISSMVTVIGSYKSGERISAKEWTSFLDVKGTVRVDPFEKFIQELPMSRSRSLMVIDSYVGDERVGFASPAKGVELYLCPPRGRIYEFLLKYLSKEHIETLNAINDGLIGLVFLRKAHVTSTISPKSSHQKHNSKKQHSSARRQQEKNAKTRIATTEPSLPVEPPSLNPEPPVDNEAMDDIPPGFGPAAAAARYEDDLPEFDFTGGSNSSVSRFPVNKPTPSQPSVRPSRPVDQIRELINKYGRGEMTSNRGGVGVQPDEDDDIPEWQPQSLNQPMPPSQQQLPTPPSHTPVGPQLVQTFQQQALPVQILNQQHHFQTVSVQPQQFSQYPNQQLEPSRPILPHLQPQLNMMQGQQNVVNPWQQGAPWPTQSGPPVQGSLLMQPSNNFGGQPLEGQFYGAPAGFAAGQNGEWRSDVNRNRGF
ncbi:hypothetical protein IFM89_037085 [Coptis chinensis]|uniref:TFIIS central domain-containing protein n=1 Tax=Coptis chinensis TaxID=261450 RepID=A0A835HPV5_9MAGN|nr:hypothetical protein IFM89_037085 [Coptis chinensis]